MLISAAIHSKALQFYSHEIRVQILRMWCGRWCCVFNDYSLLSFTYLLKTELFYTCTEFSCKKKPYIFWMKTSIIWKKIHCKCFAKLKMLWHKDVKMFLVMTALLKKIFCILNVMWIPVMPVTFPNEYW